MPFGTCPHCGARIELPASSQRCGACKGSYLPIVPEEDAAASDAEGSSEWALLPVGARGRAQRGAADDGVPDPGLAARGGEPHGGPEQTLVTLGSVLGGALSSVRGWLDARALRKPLRALALLVTLGLGGMISAAVLHVLLDPGPRARRLLEDLLRFFLSLVALPAVALLAVLVVSVLFGRAQAEPRVFWRSVIALTLGAVTRWTAVLLLSLAIAAAPAASWRWLDPDWIATPAILSGLLASFLAGWVTARFAPGAPFRHALGVGLLLVLPYAPWLLLSARNGVILAFLLAQACMLALGAWLRANSAPPGGTPAAAA